MSGLNVLAAISGAIIVIAILALLFKVDALAYRVTELETRAERYWEFHTTEVRRRQSDERVLREQLEALAKLTGYVRAETVDQPVWKEKPDYTPRFRG